MTTITIDPNYGFVLLAATSTFILEFAHMGNTSKYRGLAKVPYPHTYAPAERTDEAAHKFNCAQRSHANFVENQITFLGALLLAGIRFPLTAALMGVGWTASRWVYMLGYSRGGESGKSRYQITGSKFHWLFSVGVIGLTAFNGVAMVMGW